MSGDIELLIKNMCWWCGGSVIKTVNFSQSISLFLLLRLLLNIRPQNECTPQILDFRILNTSNSPVASRSSSSLYYYTSTASTTKSKSNRMDGNNTTFRSLAR